MTRWYDDPKWTKFFKEDDALHVKYNIPKPLAPLKCFDDCNLNAFYYAWEQWGIPVSTQFEWDTMIRNTFHTPLEARE